MMFHYTKNIKYNRSLYNRRLYWEVSSPVMMFYYTILHNGPEDSGGAAIHISTVMYRTVQYCSIADFQYCSIAVLQY